METECGKKSARSALPLYVTPRMEGDPNGDQGEGEGRKEGDPNADFRETRGRRNWVLLFCEYHRKKKNICISAQGLLHSASA